MIDLPTYCRHVKVRGTKLVLLVEVHLGCDSMLHVFQHLPPPRLPSLFNVIVRFYTLQ